MQKIEGKQVEHQLTEYGVKYDDGFSYVCGEEEDARTTRQMTGGTVVVRDVYVTQWIEVA